jgi:hypothetical protein
MTKKLEEEFNLPPIEELNFDFSKEQLPEVVEEDKSLAEINSEIAASNKGMEISQKIDAALPLVAGMETLEREMDEYAQKAMDTFADLVDLGKNVEDRHVAPIFDSASKMLAAGLQAKQAKLDKKLKMVELQMKKQRLDQQERELEAKLKAKEDDDDDRDSTIEGKIVGDRSAMLEEIMGKMRENDK